MKSRKRSRGVIWNPKSEKLFPQGLGFRLGLLMMRGIYDERGGGLLLITGPDPPQHS